MGTGEIAGAHARGRGRGRGWWLQVVVGVGERELISGGELVQGVAQLETVGLLKENVAFAEVCK